MDGSTLVQTIVDLGPWAWLILAAALFVLEIMLPGVFLLWFGVAAMVVGLIGLGVDLPLPAQFGTFVLASIVGLFTAKKWLGYGQAATDARNLNVRGNQYVGQTAVVADAIVDGRGKIKLGDSVWIVEGPDRAAGLRVKVTGSRGSHLVVEAVD